MPYPNAKLELFTDGPECTSLAVRSRMPAHSGSTTESTSALALLLPTFIKGGYKGRRNKDSLRRR